MKRYIIVSGYYEHPASNKHGMSSVEFFPIWQRNNDHYTHAEAVYIVNAGGVQRPGWGGRWIEVGNLGHVDHMTGEQRIGGWSAAFLMGCMLGYHNGVDVIFKEQDCLAFGPWVDLLYSHDAAMVTGRVNDNGTAQGFVPQSLALILHRYLLDFVQRYLAIPESDKREATIPERKFDRIAAQTGEHARADLGYDRSRPVNFDDAAFYLQQISMPEMEQLRKRKLI